MDEETEIPSSLQQTCRLCLGDEQLEDIFKQEDDLHEWIADYLSIVVNIDDQISKSICFCCRTRLQEFRSYQQQCIEVQDVLQGEITAILDKYGVRCVVCQKTCPDAKELKKHERSHIRNFICHVCDKAYHRPIRLRRHIETHHPEVYKGKSSKLLNSSDQPEESLENGEESSVESVSIEPPNTTVETNKHHDLLTEYTEDEYEDQEASVESTVDKMVKNEPNIEDASASEIVPHSIVQSIKVEELIIEDMQVDQETDFQSDKETSPTTSASGSDNRRVTCEVCGKKFRNRKLYHGHKYSVHGPRVHICPICGKGFVSRSRLATHEKYHIPRDFSSRIASPPIMDDNTETNESIEPTTSTKVDESTEVYNTEEVITPSKIDNSFDDIPKTPNTPLKQQDSSVEMSVDDLPEVVQADEEEERPFQCDICQRNFKCVKNLRAHRRVIHGPKKHECPVCNKGFTIKECMLKHMLIHKERPRNIFPLFIDSEEVFDDPVQGPRSHQCNICSESFVQIRQLKAHKANDHKNPPKIVAEPIRSKVVTVSKGNDICQMFQCSECSKLLSTRKQLFDHRKRNHRPKKHACPICGKPAVTRQDMYVHSRTHSMVYTRKKNVRAPDGSYECGICPSTFKSKTSLNTHRRLHGNRKNTCFLLSCNKSFSSHSDYKKHMMTHNLSVRKHLRSYEFLEKIKLTGDAESEVKDLSGDPEYESKELSDDLEIVAKETPVIESTDDVVVTVIDVDDEPAKEQAHIEDKVQSYIVSKSKVVEASNSKNPPAVEVQEEDTIEDSKGHTKSLSKIMTTQTCTICEQQVKSAAFEGHMNRHAGIRPYKCEKGCDELYFYCPLLLKSHITRTHCRAPIECDICHKVYPTTLRMRSHKREVHQKIHVCMNCPQIFDSSESLKKHIETANHAKRYRCEYCSCSFDRQHQMTKHMKKHVDEVARDAMDVENATRRQMLGDEERPSTSFKNAV